MNYKSVVFVISVLVGVAYSAFPSEIKKCAHGDGACIRGVIMYLFQEKGKVGLPGLNMGVIDPLLIKSVDISQGAESPVNVNLKFRNSNLEGVSTIDVLSVDGFGKDMTALHTLTIGGGHVTLAGKYEVQGRVLLLPISGAGDSNITLINPNIIFKFHGIPYEKNGKAHMKIEDLKLDGKIDRMYVHLGDLFNGDKALGDNMNAFLNENWQDIFNELKGKIFEAFGLIFQAVMNNVFAKFPYDELFSD